MTRHPLTRRGDVVHHYYPHGPAVDLLPYCGVTPGPDEDGVWHTGHDVDELFAHNAEQHPCCPDCLARAARVKLRKEVPGHKRPQSPPL